LLWGRRTVRASFGRYAEGTDQILQLDKLDGLHATYLVRDGLVLELTIRKEHTSPKRTPDCERWSKTLTLDRYGHLFPDDLGRIADAFDAVTESTADALRTAAGLRSVPSGADGL
jgi:hypothetical protein